MWTPPLFDADKFWMFYLQILIYVVSGALFGGGALVDWLFLIIFLKPFHTGIYQQEKLEFQILI